MATKLPKTITIASAASLKGGSKKVWLYASPDFNFNAPYDFVLYFHSDNTGGNQIAKNKAIRKQIDAAANAIVVAPSGETKTGLVKKWYPAPNFIKDTLESLSKELGTDSSTAYANMKLHMYGFSAGGGSLARFLTEEKKPTYIEKIKHLQFNDGVFTSKKWVIEAIKYVGNQFSATSQFWHMSKASAPSGFHSANWKAAEEMLGLAPPLPNFTAKPFSGGHSAALGKLETSKFVSSKDVCHEAPQKTNEIVEHGKGINTIPIVSVNLLESVLKEAKKIIDDRPKPTYMSYDEWQNEQTQLRALESQYSNIPPEFLGFAEPGKEPFDVRTKMTLPKDGTDADEGKKVHAPVKEISPGKWEISGEWVLVNAEQKDPKDDIDPYGGPAEDFIGQENMTPEQIKELKKKREEHKKAKAKKEPKATNKPLKETAPEAGAQPNTAAQVPTTGQPQSLTSVCSKLGSLGGGGPLGANAVVGDAVPIGGEVAPEKLQQAFQALKNAAAPDGLRKYWKRRCLQFAAKLAQIAGSSRTKKGPSRGHPWDGVNTQIHGYLPIVKTAKKERFGAGMTIRELTEQSSLKVGMIVHVKMDWSKTKAYKPTENFHHWITYVGNGKWMDSFGPSQSAKKIDNFLRGWFRKSYPKAVYVHVQEQFNNVPKDQLPKDAQPRVTAVHEAY